MKDDTIPKMTVSELLAELEKLKDKYGDYEVMISFDVLCGEHARRETRSIESWIVADGHLRLNGLFDA